MKKLNVLTLAVAAAALTGCTLSRGSANPTFNQTGVVTKEEQKANVRKVYKDSVDNVEDLETLDDDGSDTDVTDDTPTEDTSTEETPTEETDGEDTEDAEEDESIETKIDSYHVDYTYDYALKATYAGYPIFDESEKETYSLTYVKTEEDFFLDLEVSHSYKLNSRYSGAQSVHAIFQDNTLFLESSVTYGEETYSSKEAYDIRRHHIYGEFGDFFRYTYLDLLFVDGSKQDSYTALDALLDAEGVEITDATENTVTISFLYEELAATIVFNTELETIVSATFDSSAYLQNLLNKITVRPNGHGPKEEPIEGEETTEETTEEESLFKVEEAKQIMTVNFSYNDQVANKLTEEEIAEYHTHEHGKYDHYNDHSYYGDDDHGKHNHDSEGWGHSPEESDNNDYDWNWGEKDDYDDDSWWDDDNVPSQENA